jgi:hypothetical protein
MAGRVRGEGGLALTKKKLCRIIECDFRGLELSDQDDTHTTA